MKICARCKVEKPSDEFFAASKAAQTRDGLHSYCRECLVEYKKERYAEKRVAEGRMTPAEKRAAKVAAIEAIADGKAAKKAAKTEALRAEKAARNQAKKARSAERKEAKRLRDNARRNFARFLETPEEYTARLARDAANKQRHEAQARRRELLKLKRQNPTHHLCKIIGDQMRRALASLKVGSWSEYVDYTASDLRLHLEAQFEPWMTWQNYGTEWHIDHKRPVSSFNLEDPNEVRRCWALVNLRPLHAIDNIAKSNRLDPDILDELPDDFHPAHYVIFGEAAA